MQVLLTPEAGICCRPRLQERTRIRAEKTANTESAEPARRRCHGKHHHPKEGGTACGCC